MKKEGLLASVNREAVFQMLGCGAGSPVQRRVREIYEELLPSVLAGTRGSCLFGFGALPEEAAAEQYPAGTRVVYVISTIGRELSDRSAACFAQGDYLKGALLDAMADSVLFEMEAQWKPLLKQLCASRGVGILTRLEAPYDLPMAVQKAAFETLRAGEELGLSMTSGLMFDPAKTACQVFVVTEDACQFHADHDCAHCPAKACKMRRKPSVEITICSVKGTQTISCETGETILDAVRRHAGYMNAVCGGKGTCGKCRIRLMEGELAITEADQRIFAGQELADGYRLACRAVPAVPCVIEICAEEEEAFQVLEDFAEERIPVKKDALSGERDAARLHLGIAVDIGTTTLAAQLVDRTDGRLMQSASSINHQRIFGADVVSRMEASVAGKGEELRQSIRKDLQKLVGRLLAQADRSADEVELVMLAGNTTMGHLLMGYSCAGLGIYPFTPVDIGTIRGSFADVIGTEWLGETAPRCEVVLLPGITAYVGGDIAAGLYACGMGETDSVELLVDLGTNGEMAIGNRERLLVTSTAAGPAFEGGNISCGTGSIPGAICHAAILDNGRTSIETIGRKAPVGICGTGVIEMTAELLRRGLVDETGLMAEAYFEDGFPIAITPEGREISFTQKDVREMQLAKAAVRAGVETLIRRYGIPYEAIGHVYLAGGMGFQMDRKAAAAIGLLPGELLAKTTAAGNSSLAGAARALREARWQERFEAIVSVSQEIELANDEDFQSLYLEHMMFRE